MDDFEGSSKTQMHSLEQLLMNKNKRLAADLTNLKITHDEYVAENSKLKAQYEEATVQIQNLQHLVKQLEDDLGGFRSSQLNVESDGLYSKAVSHASIFLNKKPSHLFEFSI